MRHFYCTEGHETRVKKKNMERSLGIHIAPEFSDCHEPFVRKSSANG